MTTVTQWFDPKENPVHIGDYEREYKTALEQRLKDRWDGSRWMLLSDYGRVICPATDPLRWRGLAVKPKSGISSK